MKFNLKSLVTTVVSAGLFLGLLIGGYWFIDNYYVADRFEQQLYQIDGVKNVKVENGEITISLVQVSNLRKCYQQIEKIVGDKKYQIHLIDNASPVLAEMGDRSEIAIQESVYCGNFMEMEKYIQDLARQQGATAKVFVDNQRVYLQLALNKNYLYRVIDRPKPLSNFAGSAS